MATPAHFEQSAACHPAVLELVPPPLIPHQRDGGFLDQPEENYNLPVRLVPELGRISMQHSRLVQYADDEAPRLRRTMSIQLGKVSHSARITEPDSRNPRNTSAIDTVVMLHGYTEMIDAGTGKNLHDALAPHYPDKRLISIATDGVGRYCQRVGWVDALRKDFSTMARDRHRLINVLAGTGKVTLLDVSMGSVIGIELLHFDSLLPDDVPIDHPLDRRLNFDAIIHHSSAQVPPGRIISDMIIRFLPHIYKDGLRVHGSMPHRAQGLLKVALAYPRSTPALIGNLIHLLMGIDPRKVASLAAKFPTGYISGEHDPLAQNKCHLDLSANNPKNVSVYIKPGAGHADCLNAAVAAQDVVDMHRLVSNR